MKYISFLKKRFVLFASIFVLIASCDKTLDLSPPTVLSDGSFWKVPADFEKAANAFYATLAGPSAWADQNSDLFVGNASNTGSNGSAQVPSSDDGWNNRYSTIRATNRLIENYENSEDEELRAGAVRYAAEARFFRARAHFQLVSIYGDVPLITKVLDLDSEELQMPRTPRAEVMQAILADLDWAAANLPEESAIAASEKGRVSKGAAMSLKVRAALFEGTWAKYHNTGGDVSGYLNEAITTAQQIINSGEYGIFSDFGTDESYRKLFIEEGEESPESILARRYVFNDDFQITHNTTRWVRTNVNSPTKQLADMYVCTDGLPIERSPLFQGYDTTTSEFQDRDPRMSQTIFLPGTVINFLGSDETIFPLIGGGNNGPTKSGYLTYKFVSDRLESQQGNAAFDYQEIRFAEVLISLAEALYERDGSISDSDLNKTVNELRGRVGVAPLTNSMVTLNNLNMLTEIRRERTIEFALEGFRAYDLRRWKESENILPVSLKGVKFEGSDYETTPPNDGLVIGSDVQVDPDGFIIADDISNRSFTQKLYLAPIPADQLQLNSNLVQNPGW
jgi:hypothetical protein